MQVVSPLAGRHAVACEQGGDHHDRQQQQEHDLRRVTQDRLVALRRDVAHGVHRREQALRHTAVRRSLRSRDRRAPNLPLHALNVGIGPDFVGPGGSQTTLAPTPSCWGQAVSGSSGFIQSPCALQPPGVVRVGL